MPNTQLAIPSAQSNLYWISYISRVVGIWNQSLKLGCEIWCPSGWLMIIMVGQGWWEILLNFHSLRRRFSNNYCGSAMEVDNIFNYNTGHGHCSTHTCVSWVQHGGFPGKKLACKFLHKLLHANLHVFLRWLILLVKIHATCEYFFTTANMADVKLETDIVEKCLFVVRKKTTYYTLSLTTNIMFCKSCYLLKFLGCWLKQGFKLQYAILHVNLGTCYLPRWLLFWNKFNVSDFSTLFFLDLLRT